MSTSDLETARDLEVSGGPPAIDGQIVGATVDLDEVVNKILLRRGIDPARLDDMPPVMSQRGNLLGHQEAVEVFTDQALRALSHYADGEFDFDRLPEINQYVAQWVEAHKRDPKEAPLLVLRGTTGCGKTSQCFCLLRDTVLHHASRGERFSWYFITHRNFAATVQPGSGRDPDRLMHNLLGADLVVLDDLGDFNTQDFGKGECYTSRLLNHRLHHRLPTVIDTNLPFVRGDKVKQEEEKIGRRIAVLADTLDDRIISRLKGGWVVNMPHVDHRQMQGRVFGP